MEKEIKVYYSTSTGPGGQRRDRKKTAVRVHHLPSGIIVRVDRHTSQARNKKIAFQLLEKRLEKLKQPRKKRIPTRIPRSIKERRLQTKKRHSQRKKLRRKPPCP